MSTMAATFREGVLERRFRFAEHGTTLARDTMAGVTTFIVMSYIIFLNPIILTSVKPKTGAPLPFEGVVTATCVVAAVMTILMGLYSNKAYALAPGLGINAIVAFQLVGQNGLSFPSAMGLIVLEGIVVTALVLTGLREQIMRAIPLELKKAIAIGIGLFIAFIGLYNSGIVVTGAGEPVTLGHFTTWPIFVTFVGIILTLALRARGFKGDLLRRDHRHDGRRDDRQPRDEPSRVRHVDGDVARLEPHRRLGQLVALRQLRLPRVLEARSRVGARLGVRALPVGLLRHDGHARRRRQAGRLSRRGRADARHPQAAARRLARRDRRRRVVDVFRDDVHRVRLGRRGRRPHRLGRGRRGSDVHPVPLLRTDHRRWCRRRRPRPR